MKRHYFATLFILLLMFLTSCAKLIKKESYEVDVVIVDTYHRGSYFTNIYNGKVFMQQFHPEVNEVKVRYEDIYKTFDSQALYEKYKDCVGDTIKGILEVKTYDNGKIKRNIQSIM